MISWVSVRRASPRRTLWGSPLCSSDTGRGRRCLSTTPHHYDDVTPYNSQRRRKVNFRHDVYPNVAPLALRRGHLGAIGQQVVTGEVSCLRSTGAIDKIIKTLSLERSDTVWCASVGMGSLPLSLAPHAKKVIVSDPSSERINSLLNRVGDVEAHNNLEARVAAPLAIPPNTPIDVFCGVEVPLMRPRMLFGLLNHHISHPHSPLRSALCVFPKGIAHCLTATPGTTAYTRLSVNVQRYADLTLSRSHLHAEDYLPTLRSLPILVEMTPKPRGEMTEIDFNEWTGFTSIVFSRRRLRLVTSLAYIPSVVNRLEAHYKSTCVVNRTLPSKLPFVTIIKGILKRRNLGTRVAMDLDSETLGTVVKDFNNEGIRFATVGEQLRLTCGRGEEENGPLDHYLEDC